MRRDGLLAYGGRIRVRGARSVDASSVAVQSFEEVIRMSSAERRHDAGDAGYRKSLLLDEVVAPDLRCLYLAVLDRVGGGLASLHRDEVHGHAGIHVGEVDVLLFEPFPDLPEGECDVRIARMIVRLDLLGDARSDEAYDYVVAVQLPEIRAVRLERRRYRSELVDILREVLPDQLHHRRARGRDERRRAVLVEIHVQSLRDQRCSDGCFRHGVEAQPVQGPHEVVFVALELRHI